MSTWKDIVLGLAHIPTYVLLKLNFQEECPTPAWKDED